MKNKILCLFTACLIIFSLFGFSSFAEEGQYMHIIYNDNDEALSGVTFRLYYLGSDSDGELQPDSVFDDYKCNFNISDAEKRKNLALTLEAYALRDNLPCYSETVTDENGFADFDGKMLSRGVWLLIADKHIQNEKHYYTEPVIILLPFGESNTVVAKPKFRCDEDVSDEDVTSIRVIKAWKNDTEESRPESIEVVLLKDGTPESTVSLSAADDWQYVWTSLSAKNHWTVAEKNLPEGYKVSVSLTENTFLITNEKEPDEDVTEPGDDDPMIPETGMLMWPVPYLALIGLLVFIIGFVYYRRNETKDEA